MDPEMTKIQLKKQISKKLINQPAGLNPTNFQSTQAMKLSPENSVNLLKMLSEIPSTNILNPSRKTLLSPTIKIMPIFEGHPIIKSKKKKKVIRSLLKPDELLQASPAALQEATRP